MTSITLSDDIKNVFAEAVAQKKDEAE